MTVMSVMNASVRTITRHSAYCLQQE